MKFDIQTGKVRIRLTNHGRSVLRSKGITEYSEVDGWSTWGLLDLMQIFGRRVFIRVLAPFDPVIEIVETEK